MKLFSTLALIALAAGTAQAAEFSPAELLTATQSAVKLFSDANPAHVSHLTGFKTWKSGADAKVKVYMTHDGMAMEYNYLCQAASGQIRCSAL